ncbi:MAG: hypothetical protein R2705_24470 [Ilumatobacteraceae bacterium]
MQRILTARPPITFAHRARDRSENTLEAFALGLRLGASGLEGDLKGHHPDGIAVLVDGVVGGRFARKRSISTVQRRASRPHPNADRAVPGVPDRVRPCPST